MRTITQRDVVVGLFAATVVAVLFVQKPAHTESSSGALHDCYRKQESNKQDIVECSEGDVLVGGGGDCYGDGGNWHSWLVGSMPSGTRGWKTTCQNVKDGTKQVYGNSFALCCKK
ncbi:MAG TPA: hypothetical protein VIF62_27685, partial [Labilithrix sp.]